MAIQQQTLDTLNDAVTVQVGEENPGFVSFQLTSHGATMTVTFEGTVNDSDWVSLLRRDVASDATPSGTTAAGNGVFVVNTEGLLKVRARASTVSSGSVKVDALVQRR